MKERRTQQRHAIRLTNTQWAVVAEALGQMVKIHASRLGAVAEADPALLTGHLSAFDALSRTYADLVRELAQAGLTDASARGTAQTLDEAFALLESRLAGGSRQ